MTTHHAKIENRPKESGRESRKTIDSSSPIFEHPNAVFGRVRQVPLNMMQRKDILVLQRTMGNRAVQRLIQAKTDESENAANTAAEKKGVRPCEAFASSIFQRQAEGSGETEKGGEEAAPEYAYIGYVGGQLFVLTEKDYQARKGLLVEKMRREIKRGIEAAQSGRETQARHLTEVRGVAGFLSDVWNDVYPPYEGIWSNATHLFELSSDALNQGDIKASYRYLVRAATELDDANRKWSQYMQQTIAGAESVVSTLETVRDAAFVVEVGLFTGGLAYGALGGGAVAAGTGTLVGAGTATVTAAGMEGEFGQTTRGALAEIKKTGIVDNLKLSAHALGGMVMGTGEGLKAIGESLLTLFTDPGQFFEDLLRMPEIIEQLWSQRKALWAYFNSLPPEEQAYQVGRFTGHLEALLISIQTGKAAGAALSEGISVPLPNLTLVPSARGEALLSMTTRVAALKTEFGVLVFESGVTVAAPGAFAMGLEEISGLLGEGPEAEAVRVTGARGAGVVRKPRHHILPKEFRSFFEERGFKGERNIDRFCVELEEAGHQALHGGGNWKIGRTWPGEWNRKIMSDILKLERKLKRKANFDEIMTLARELMSQYDITKPFINYKGP